MPPSASMQVGAANGTTTPLIALGAGSPGATTIDDPYCTAWAGEYDATNAAETNFDLSADFGPCVRLSKSNRIL